MMKLVAMMTAVSMLFGMATAVAETAATTEENPYYRDGYSETLIWDTKGISAYKSKKATNTGTVENLTYETPAYAINAVLGTDYTVTKSVNVYLPYGYDPSVSYNIIYLMHGGGDDQDYWLTDLKGDRSHGKTTLRVVDHTIEDGLSDPVIIVTPTFYTSVEGVEVTDEQCADVITQIGEPNYTGYSMLETWFFADELRNNIIPLVESKYSTYAAGDVSEANLIATRDHRAYCGLSMGSITGFHSVLMQNMDLFAWVGNFSGAKCDEALFRTTVQEKYADYPMNFWYNGNGTEDQAFEEHYELYNQLMESMPEKFTDGVNSCFITFPGGGHNYAAWIADLYNCMTVFFK